MKPLIYLAFCLVATAAPITAAGAALSTADTLVEQGTLDRRAHDIAAQLRCLVCQGQTVAVSDSDLAADMREVIHDKLRQGWGEQRIVAFFVERYGDFVLYRPPLEYATWALWFGPLVMLAGGLAVLVGYLRRRARMNAAATLTPEELQRARMLLGARKEDGS